MKYIISGLAALLVIIGSSGCKNPTELGGEPPIITKDPVPPVPLQAIEVKGDGHYDGFDQDDADWETSSLRLVQASIDTSDEQRHLLSFKGAVIARTPNFVFQKLQPGRVFHEVKEIMIQCDSVPVGTYIRDDILERKIIINFLVKRYERRMNNVIDTNTFVIPLGSIDPFSAFSLRILNRVSLPNTNDKKVVIAKCDFNLYFPTSGQGSRKMRLSGRTEIRLRMP